MKEPEAAGPAGERAGGIATSLAGGTAGTCAAANAAVNHNSTITTEYAGRRPRHPEPFGPMGTRPFGPEPCAPQGAILYSRADRYKGGAPHGTATGAVA